MTPVFEIIADAVNITQKINRRLLSIRINDERGLESDTAEIQLDDRDNALQWPKKGAILEILIGFKSTGLVNKGKYVVDALSHGGPPDVLTITARAADMREQLKTLKTRSFHQTTLGNVVEQIAIDHQLKPAISAQLYQINIEHIDQTNESDLNFLTRLAKTYDAIAKPANNHLLFVDKGSAESATGRPLPAIVIDRTDCENHSYNESGRVEYTGVKVFYTDTGKARRRSVILGKKGKLKTLSATSPTKEHAEQTARSALKKLNREVGKLQLSLPVGNAMIIAGSAITTTSFRPPMLGDWLVSTVSHTLNNSGLKSNLQLEKKV